ncbi:aminopeptidase [Actinoplanes sp. URMC 104]|uniref:aminopeptidase n=1 Tax=Actinoplanes sp. URMC 104 TaxID=3423409 RepID=UPI003F1B19E2
MIDDDVACRRLAEVLVHHSVRVRPGDLVLVRATGPEAEPLVRALVRRVLASGATPVPYVHLADEDSLILDGTADPEQWRAPNPLLAWAYDHVDVVIRIDADSDPAGLRTRTPQEQQARQNTRYSLIYQQLRRLEEGTLRRVTTHYPTRGYAAMAGRDPERYRAMVWSAMLLDAEDPVAEWEAMHARMARRAAVIRDGAVMRVEGDGVDLTMDLGQRPVDVAHGRQNMPDGEIDFAPLETSVNGWIRATEPAFIHDARVEDLCLRFEQGRVVEWRASTNEQVLAASLGFDDAAGRIGEIGLGMNPRLVEPVGIELFDNKIAGMFSVSLGQGHVPTGSANASPVHWTFLHLLDGNTRIRVDDVDLLEAT